MITQPAFSHRALPSGGLYQVGLDMGARNEYITLVFMKEPTSTSNKWRHRSKPRCFTLRSGDLVLLVADILDLNQVCVLHHEHGIGFIIRSQFTTWMIESEGQT